MGITTTVQQLWGRSLHWERGLKLLTLVTYQILPRRSLHWERGLKRARIAELEKAGKVAPFIGSVD